MEFTPTAPKNALTIRFIEGSLNKFTGEELHIGIGQGKDSRQHLPGLRSRLFKPSPLNRRKTVIFMRKVASVAKQHQAKAIELEWKDIRRIAEKKISDFDLGSLVGTAFVMADYEHNSYKTPPKEGFISVETVAILNAPSLAKKGVARGKIIGVEVNACRELANTPGGDMTPKLLADAAVQAAKGTRVKVKVLGRAEMEKLGMGAVLGIAKGSVEEPQFIVMEYWGAGRHPMSMGHRMSNRGPVVLIGKGVTFDTGGLNIKPGDHMYEMHMDMSGGAAVIHATVLAAKLGIKKNVVALVPAVENNPGGGAMRPGDILKSLSGKTIEILNTDAEGRVILADAITYAKKYNPAAVVDVATLTGAALTALGTVASAFMTNKDATVPMLMEMADKSGDYLWPLPLWEEYDDMVKGTFGDVPNISTMGNSRHGGVIAGGKFLEVFAKELGCLWVHLDIAPRMTSYPGEHLSKGAAGAPVRFLLEFIEKNKQK
jgi:leucyl aminopeptidase